MLRKFSLFITLVVMAITFLASCNKKEVAKDVNAYYTCPMHPNVHEDHPGRCPICGMDLVKKEK